MWAPPRIHTTWTLWGHPKSKFCTPSTLISRAPLSFPPSPFSPLRWTASFSHNRRSWRSLTLLFSLSPLPPTLSFPIFPADQMLNAQIFRLNFHLFIVYLRMGIDSVAARRLQLWIRVKRSSLLCWLKTTRKRPKFGLGICYFPSNYFWCLGLCYDVIAVNYLLDWCPWSNVRAIASSDVFDVSDLGWWGVKYEKSDFS